MARTPASRTAINECIIQLDAELAREEMRPSVIKALTTKLETLERLHARDIEHKESETVTENGRLTKEFAALKESFKEITPEQFRAQAEELRTTKAQCENLRNSNNSYAREIAAAKGETQSVTEQLRWLLTERISGDDRKLSIAVSAFVKFHAKAAPIVDCLFSSGTCKEFVRISYSKQSLIETVRLGQHFADSDDVLPVQFATLYAKEKHQLDIPELLKAQAAENFRRENEADRIRGEEQRAREAAAFRMMRSNAQEEMIQRAEYGASPVVHVDPSDRW